jgi:hypothetical protein
MDDAHLLINGMRYCEAHRSWGGSCSGCPLEDEMCISRSGQLRFVDEKPKNEHVAAINFAHFVDQFKNMVNQINSWATSEGLIPPNLPTGGSNVS